MQPMGALRRKDTTRGPPLRILSLDGGGVRGYSMLIILQELMHRTFVETEGRAPKRHEIPKPCDHFDLIAGTGTGGLIAIMLGRLRLDVDTCKDVYVRMTRRVFETDKTVLGIPYRGTMFKASKLEEAIKECVAQHTVYEDEGNDLISLARPQGSEAAGLPRHRTMSNASRYSALGMNNIPPSHAMGRGNADAMLYDQRENRTKTAVTAMLSVRGPQPASVALLRSYDSRKEPAPDVNCTIWEAGRATCATGLAFKPIQVGQSRYHDDGMGTYNPAPQVLDEAIINEWPGREIGCFVSIGTGKRPTDSNSPSQQHLWWESLAGGSIGEFAEARRKLLNKIEGCEEIHQAMIARRLPERGVDPKVYFRFNVEVGLGDFKMNEWNRLSEISSSTRVYLARPAVTTINDQAATKLAQVHFARKRNALVATRGSFDSSTEAWDWRPVVSELATPTSPVPIAVELPAGDMDRSPPRGRRQSSLSSTHSPNVGLARNSPPANNQPPMMSIPQNSPPLTHYSPNMGMPRNSPPQVHRYSVTNPDETRPVDSPQSSQSQSQPLPYRPSEVRRSDLPSQSHPQPQTQPQTQPQRQTQQKPQTYTVSPDDMLPHAPEPKRRPPGVPPLPPKTPIPEHERQGGSGSGGDLHPRPLSVAHSYNTSNQSPGQQGQQGHTSLVSGLPYPDTDGPPPAVNLARKPQTGRR